MSRNTAARLITTLLGSTALLAGCAETAYLGQAASGHLDLLAKRKPIAQLIEDQQTPAELRARLRLAREARDFASRELALPENASYRSYSDLGRDYAVWNLVAAPALSLEPRSWCWPIAGCLSYRGYFDRSAAEAHAERLANDGDDVFTGPVAAYSTLGWFADPLLNTMLARGEVETAALIFHELAHQRVYVQDDARFNESYAVAVEIEGVRLWLQRRGEQGALERWLAERERESEVRALLTELRAQLERVYAAPLAESARAARKRELIDQTRARYAVLKEHQGWDGRFDTWLGPGLNNALLSILDTYERWVPAFQAMLARHDGDFAAFHADVDRLAKRPRAERERILAGLGRFEHKHAGTTDE